jgi:hypothetical protein
MGGVSNKTTSHITRVLDLTYFSRSRSDFKYGYLVAIFEKQLSAITPELMPGSSTNFNNTWVLDLTYFSRSQRSKLQKYYEVVLTVILIIYDTSSIREPSKVF